MKSTKETQREQLEADMARYLDNGGQVTPVPYGYGTDNAKEMKTGTSGIPRYVEKKEDHWRRYKVLK